MITITRKKNEIWKKDSQSIIDSIEKEFDLEYEQNHYIDPPQNNIDYIEAYYENQGAFYVEKSLDEELMALHEMQIIYSFRQIEISLKKFILLREPTIELRSIQRWDSLKDKFKAYGIKLGVAKGYTYINQLREVNNALKYSNKITDRVTNMNIKEFSELEYFTPDSLANFHSSVIEHKRDFLCSIAYEIGSSMQLYSDEVLSMSLTLDF